MLNKFSLEYKGNYIKAIVNGEKDLELSKRFWDEAVPFCKKHNCYKIFGTGYTTSTHSVNEAYELPEVFMDHDIDHKFKIAWIEKNPDSKVMFDFMGNVLGNRGFPIMIFHKEEEALNWLLE